MLPTLHRLTKGSDFKLVYSSGRSVNGKRLRLKFVANSVPHARVGIVVANSVSKHATKRNTVKRLVREAVRAQLNQIRPGVDIVISANVPALGATLEEIQGEIKWLLDRAKLRI